MATPSSSRRRWPPRVELHRLPRCPPQGKEEEEEKKEKVVEESLAPELPLDVLLVVFHKLDQVDIIMAAGQVCRSWRRAARDVPALWRRIDMRFDGGLSLRVNRYKMARSALWFSAGQCEAFRCHGAVNKGVLSLLADSKVCLKSLQILSCDIWSSRSSDCEFRDAVTMFTQLEELEFSNCWFTLEMTCEAVSKSCPLLKRLRLNNRRFSRERYRYTVDVEAMSIAQMRGLCSLQLFAGCFSNDGLTAILDGCTRLESLDTRHCFNIQMDDGMLAKCSRIETLRLPGDSTDDYDLEFSPPDMSPLLPEGEIDWEFSAR